jgi:NTP pyrophosphatase (non-canonical NTP hydrolase)
MEFNKQAAASASLNLPPTYDFTLDDYQERIAVFDFPDPVKGPVDDDGRYPLWYYGLGITGEAGEIADKLLGVHSFPSTMWAYAMRAVSAACMLADRIKKLYRNEGYLDTVYVKPPEITGELRLALAKEIGDELWYLSRLASKVGVTMGEVANLNIAKLADRANRDVLRSSGDNR